jgi:hypothetical protein
MATNTMEAIKKKMQAMRLEKESAFDRADQLENKLMEQKLIYEKVSTSMSRVTNAVMTAHKCSCSENLLMLEKVKHLG